MNEFSYDRHFTNKNRIVQLNTVWNQENSFNIQPICIRSAYTDLPQKVPGIEKAVQLYRGFDVEIIRKSERFQNLTLLYADPGYFNIFNMKFIYGSANNALTNPNSAVITRQKTNAYIVLYKILVVLYSRLKKLW